MGDVCFRTIDALAERCGAYCWVEHRLFELTGRWTRSPGDAELRVRFSVMSAQHAQRAGHWNDRLPSRAGIDRQSLVVPPPGPLAAVLAGLTEDVPAAVRMAALTIVVLPRLLTTYEEDLARSSPVSEGPVMATLRLAGHGTAGEIALGHALLQEGLQLAEDVTGSSNFCAELERKFEGITGVFPAVRPS
jgi:hypothetical protein